MRICRLIFAAAVLTACGRQPAPPPTAAPPTATPAPASSPAANPAPAETGLPGSRAGESGSSFFDPAKYPGAVIETHFVDPATLSATERKFGMAPKRDPRVSYQDGIVLMEHGDQAIRDAQGDGMTFTFDAAAEHVGEFAEGKIIFATGRVVGRVGQLKRDGDTVTVKLAPVQITEIVKKGTFMLDSTFQSKDLLIYSAPDFPSTLDYSDKQQSRSIETEADTPQYLPAAFVQTQGAPLPSGLGKDLSTRIPPKPPTLPAADLHLSAGLAVRPAIGSDGGIGVSFKYVKNGVVVGAYGQMVLPAPKVHFLLDIDSSGIKTFGIEIIDNIGLRMTIEASSDVERFINLNTTTVTPLDLSLPCPIGGLPLSLSFKSSFNVHTKFAAKTSTLTGGGEWSLNGTLFAGYKDGEKSHETAPPKVTASLAHSVSGASLGINTVGGAFNIRPMIGLGGFGFETGVYLGVTFTGDIVKQSSIAMTDCHGASGSATVDSGVGYQLPGPLVDFINTILSLFTKYRMDKQGTLIQGWGGTLFKINEDIPTNCAGLGTSATTPAST